LRELTDIRGDVYSCLYAMSEWRPLYGICHLSQLILCRRTDTIKEAFRHVYVFCATGSQAEAGGNIHVQICRHGGTYSEPGLFWSLIRL